MNENIFVKLLESHGIKPTANRIIIAKTLAQADGPMSMKDLEYAVLSLDKSSIFRALTLFREHRFVHAIEGGDGSVKYEICRSHDDDIDDDEHVHFYCENCHRTICLHGAPLPDVEVPAGYEPRGASFIIRGLCPACRKAAK